jgi:hypothetical protein
MNPLNPYISVVNEILLVYYLNGRKLRPSLQKILNEHKKLIGVEHYKVQKKKSKVMAEEFIRWIKRNNYAREVDRAWWTSRNGYLSKVLKMPVDSKKNPCDVLVRFKNGNYLGISAKTTQYTCDLPFKSKGVRNVENFLNIDIQNIIVKHTNKFVKKNRLKSTMVSRKEQIRKSDKLVLESEKLSKIMFGEIIDVVYRKLVKCNQKKRRDFIINHWLDSSKSMFPPYLKITAMGKEEPFGIKIENPFENINIRYINRNNIKFHKTGNNSILVYAGNRKIMRIRIRASSQKFASTIKFSGDAV